MREGRECLDLWEVFKSAKSEECRKCLLIDYSEQARHAFDLQMLIVKLYGKNSDVSDAFCDVISRMRTMGSPSLMYGNISPQTLFRQNAGVPYIWRICVSSVC